MMITCGAIGRIAFVVAVSASCAAVPMGRVDASDGNPGRVAYFKYCSACHGDDGRGDGVVASTMRPKPANLTTLAQRHGGVFPDAQVRDIIDGRTPIAAHGASKMPVWGRAFAEEQTWEEPQAHSQSQVQLIVDHLRSIQASSAD
jgi:mono/diheme cytochrome c family protein